MKKTALLIALMCALSACNVSVHSNGKVTRYNPLEQFMAVSAEKKEALSKQLVEAVKNDNVEQARSLIKQGADVNYSGNFPLFNVKSVNMAALLLEKGANINIKSTSNSTPLTWQLSNYGGEACKNTEVIKFLIEKGADINTKEGKNDFMPLHYAIQSCEDVDIIKLLIKKGADIHAKTGEWTPLRHAASYNKNVEVTKLLIEQGADINSPLQTWHDATILEAAYINGNIEVAKWLKTKGANGRNPNELLFFKKISQKNIQNLVKKSGANINTKNSKGLTPLDVAESNNDSDMVKAITELGGKHSDAYKTQKRKEELAQQKAEKEKAKQQQKKLARLAKCEHVYVGQQKWILDTEFFVVPVTVLYEVMGVSPKAGKATIKYIDGPNRAKYGMRKEVPCTDIPE